MSDRTATPRRFRLKFRVGVDMDHVEELLGSAREVAGFLVGEPLVRMHGVHLLVRHQRVVVQDVSSMVGVLIMVVFIGLCSTQLGRESFAVHSLGERIRRR